MAETFVQVAPDGAGKQIDGFQPTGSTSIRQTVTIGDPNIAGEVVDVTIGGAMNVNLNGGETSNMVLSTIDGALQVAPSDYENPKDRLNQPGSTDGSEPTVMVAMDPNWPLQLDPGQVLTVGGKAPGGAMLPMTVGADGGLRLTDAPAPIYGQGAALNQQCFAVDTTGYNSIAVQLTGTFSLTTTAQTSNDGVNWVAVTGWPVGGAAIPSSAPAAVGLWVFPTIGRFFKLYVSAWTSGSVQTIAQLRAQPVPLQWNIPSVNAQQIAGTNTVTANVAGMQAVGGNVAAGSASTSYPVQVAGSDGTNVQRIKTDTSGQTIVVPALDPTNVTQRLRVNALGSLVVEEAISSAGEDGNAGLLSQILRELKQLNFYTRQLPYYMSNGFSVADEDSAFRDDPSLYTN